MITLDQLQAKRAEYLHAKELHEAQANAAVGAISVLNELIEQMQQPEPTDPPPP